MFVTALSDARAVIGTKEGINVYSHSLKSEKSAAFSGENPVIKHNGDKILVFHKGSEKAFFMNGKKNIPITASGNILTGAVNENGYFALLTEEKGFKAEIVVYDKNGEEFYKWHSAENFVTDITLSPSNTAFAASDRAESGYIFKSVSARHFRAFKLFSPNRRSDMYSHPTQRMSASKMSPLIF